MMKFYSPLFKINERLITQCMWGSPFQSSCPWTISCSFNLGISDHCSVTFSIWTMKYYVVFFIFFSRTFKKLADDNLLIKYVSIFMEIKFYILSRYFYLYLKGQYLPILKRRWLTCICMSSYSDKYLLFQLIN